MPEQDLKDGRRVRLSSIDRAKDLLPLRRATELNECSLYWLPVNAWPPRLEDKLWLMAFFDRFSATIVKKLGLRSEVFLQAKVLYPDLLDTFTGLFTDQAPIIGLVRRPGAPVPKAPSPEQLNGILDGALKYDLDDYMPDLTYWFVKKQESRYRELFLGYAGLSILYLKPDPKTVAPPLPFSKKVREHPMFPKLDVDAFHEGTFAMLDGFQEKSKQVFGVGLESNVVYPGLRFILPNLQSADFFTHRAELPKWFEVFDIFMAESRQDQGILLASKTDIEDDLIDLILDMREGGLLYQER